MLISIIIVMNSLLVQSRFILFYSGCEFHKLSLQLEERMAAEEEELEEFRMLEQAAADKSINSLIGMLKFAPSSVVKAPTCHTVEEEEEVKELDKVWNARYLV